MLFPIVLASTSPARKRLLEAAGIAFAVRAPLVDEASLKVELGPLLPCELAQKLAQYKALSLPNRNTLIIGADQVCEFEGHALGKAGHADAAINQLQRLSGKIHTQHTASCIALNNEIVWQACAHSSLKMKPLSEDDIRQYVARDKPFFAAGSYHIEQNGQTLFDCIDGDLDAIEGLPVKALCEAIMSLQVA